MSNFVKLDTGILNSSLWIERDLRSVFITALVMAKPYELKEPTAQIEVRSLEPTGWMVPVGWYGLVEAAGVGIIRADGIENIDEGMATLEKLCGPDPESRSREFDGRRMARVNGGYLVLNYFTYRERDYRSNGKNDSYVYYAQDGEHVKIGMSKNPWARMADIRVSRPGVAIVATERGSFDLESQRHRQFKSDCVGGEWYRLSEALQTHINLLHSSERTATVATGVATAVATKRQRQRREVETTKTTNKAPEKQSPFPKTVCDALYETWVSKRGAIQYSSFRKALLPLFPAKGSRFSEEELTHAIEAYDEYVSGLSPRDAGFESIHRFAGEAQRWVRLGAMPAQLPGGELTERGQQAVAGAL